MTSAWDQLGRPAPAAVSAAGAPGAELRAGSRVRLVPRPGGDIFDIVLRGRAAIVEAVEQDIEGTITLAVVVEDDPGRDLGLARQPGHRFFFSVDEVEPLEPAPALAPAPGSAPASTAEADLDAPTGPGAATAGRDPRILVAGIGNVFLGDDGFGVALADRLWRRSLPPGVEVVDFGIRGMDLAFAMQDGYDAVVLLDATPRGGEPGTLYVIDAGDTSAPVAVVDAHGMDPVSVLSLARSLGGAPPPTYVVGCEPRTRMSAEDEEIVAELSEPVRAAVETAVDVVERLLHDIRAENPPQEVPRP